MRWLAAMLVVAAPVAAPAQEAREVAASAPIHRSVTIYRAPGRNGGSLSLSRLGGFAVITETREISLPAGEARLRFEGVADGIIAQSALVTGLPGGVIEKNRDAALLSPSSLMRAFVGRDLGLQRTDARTGKVTLLPARLVSASDQGVIFATAGGNEALRCSGLPETFRFSGLAGGAAVPTLSVLTRSARPLRARVSLTYIAENFDWNANYIAHIGPDGHSLDLTGWITLANGNGVSLINAQTQIVAGGLNRAYGERFTPDQPRVVARCWPMATTSDIPERAGQGFEPVSPLLDGDTRPAARQPLYRRMMAVSVVAAPVALRLPEAEQLGDLKLYRLPEDTTIAARQMKQTRLIDQRAIPFETRFRAEVQLAPWVPSSPPRPATLMLRFRNDKAHHLGLPLPAGAILVDQAQGGQVMVLGETALRDTAEQDRMDLAVGPASDITCAWSSLSPGKVVVTLANASAQDAAIELRLIASGGWAVDSTGLDAPRVDGVPTMGLHLAGGERRIITIDLRRASGR